jgi:hypothetical protein
VEFHASLLPEVNTIQVGDTAHVRLEVDETAVQFNGYRISIRYRPDLVDFLPPVIEGPLMTGACGQTFSHLGEPDDSTLTYQHAILCGGNPLNGPGLLSTYSFVGLADGTSPITVVSHPDNTFTDAGVWINPQHPTFPRQVVIHHASIAVGSGTGITPGPSGSPRFRLGQNRPNPCAPSTSTPVVGGSGERRSCARRAGMPGAGMELTPGAIHSQAASTTTA